MATFTKLRSGDWGITGPAAEVREGSAIQVRKKSGDVKTVVVKKVVWSGNGKAIAAIEDSARRSGSSRGRGGICAECEEPRRNLVECSDSSGIVALCCPRCAGMPDYMRSFA